MSDTGIVKAVCRWQVGPAWKDGGETCVCSRPEGHAMPHECDCGAWFEGCGRSRRPRGRRD